MRVKLEMTTTEKLIQLDNILEKDNVTLKDWQEIYNDEKQLRDYLLDNITNNLMKVHYDGPDDYNSIYWFAKGLQLPPPKPTRRYIDSCASSEPVPGSPEYVENAAINDLFRINFQPEIKHHKLPHNSRYKKLMHELLTEPPILRPLPPEIMKPLKPYATKMFEEDNKDLIKFLDEFGHDFNSNNEEYIIVNIPHNMDEALRLLNRHRAKYYKDSEVVIKNKNTDPIVVYYLNKFTSVEDIFNFLENVVFKEERKPFKLTFELSGIFESQISDLSHSGAEVLLKEKGMYNYEARTINPLAANYKYTTNIPVMIQMNADLEKVKFYIESVLHNYSVTESSTKLTIVSSVAFTVSRLVKVTGKIDKLPEEFIKSRLIIADNEDDKLCWYRFLAICLDPSLIKRKLFHRTSQANRLLCEEYGHPYTTHLTNEARNVINNFNGTTMEEMKESAEKHNINVNIYEYDESSKTYDISEQWFFNELFKTCSALLFSKGQIIHIMYIIDPERLTNILICPKCRSYVVRNKNRMGKQRMEKHTEKCDGKFKKNYIPEKASLPYCPHILNNPVYEYCLAHNLEFRPQMYYMTYDFETMERVINEAITKSTTINSRLIPLSVSCCIKSTLGLTTKHFDARDKEFIAKWIDFMFEQSKIIVEDKIKFYHDMLKIENIEEIVKDINTVTVFGFNSSRFDSNLFKEYFNYRHWRVNNNSLIGTASSLKQFILQSRTTKTQLKFIDAQSFVAGGTLKQFGKDFGGVDNSNKGVFPYEAINSNNFNEILSKSEPFKHEDFYSSLTQKNLLTTEEYQAYLEDGKKYKDRWDYLLSYNDNDVEMMIKPIDNLIALNAEYNVDLISNLSLSKNAACIKYALAYKDFDPNKDYDIINKVNTFKPTLEWWKWKCEGYYYQDENFNKHNLALRDSTAIQRNLDKCVNENDFGAFMEMYKNSKCHLCGEHFTKSNRPTLDRINNDIGHELSNCKLACAACNSLRSKSDDKITRLRIQLKKFCKLNHLPTTLTNEKEYFDLREGITGGLSMVMHRMNLRGITKINRFRYDSESHKVISGDLPHTVSHVVGVDFNSLYPSAFSSTYHEFNPYHGGIMYMPGSLIGRLECFDSDGDRNEENYQKCMNTIYSKHRFEPNPQLIFRAKVKLECPEDKINDLINFPPVFRNFAIKNNEETIGSYMYEYGKKNKIGTIDKTDTKLTMTLDTMNEFKSFGCYYLWFLIDLGLKVVDIQNIAFYEANMAFKSFVDRFMGARQDIIAGVKKGNDTHRRDPTLGCEKFYKISMNGSYGYDGMNTEKYSKVKICDTDKTYQAIISDTYISGSKIANDTFLIQSNPKSYHCKTCIQTAFFTLDNAKFWYLTFIYKFMYRCLDVDKFHFTSGDTDSAYFAVAGDMNAPISQVFDYIIKDKKFYDENIYKFMPDPSLNTVYNTVEARRKKIRDEKKLLGCCVEKYGMNQIALCPKCYTIFNNDGETKSLKLKGVSLKTNKLSFNDYKDILDNETVKSGKNINLQLKNNIMSRITICKNALTGFHNKMIVLPNQACAPFIRGLTAKDYSIVFHTKLNL